uniref:Uncharacterized protein n=1 Tax=Opuntia streptacantha TaxID=393608 RepID=A0A7C8YTC1_OPUST
MASFWPFSLTFITLTAVLLASKPTSSSYISLAPALSPYAAPTALPPDNHYQELSPETTPLFPSPMSGDGLPPTESSMPTIPASLSPPNPDAYKDPAFSPSGGGADAAEGFSLPSASRAPALHGPTDMLVKLIPATLVALVGCLVN